MRPCVQPAAQSASTQLYECPSSRWVTWTVSQASLRPFLLRYSVKGTGDLEGIEQLLDRTSHRHCLRNRRRLIAVVVAQPLVPKSMLDAPTDEAERRVRCSPRGPCAAS